MSCRTRSFEQLESRAMLTGDVLAAVVHGELKLTGDVSANEVLVTQLTKTSFAVTGLGTTINGSAKTYIAAGVCDGLNIDLGAAHDAAVVVGLGDVRVIAHTQAGADTVLNLADGKIGGVLDRVTGLLDDVDVDDLANKINETLDNLYGSLPALPGRQLVYDAIDQVLDALHDLPDLDDLVDDVGGLLGGLSGLTGGIAGSAKAAANTSADVDDLDLAADVNAKAKLDVGIDSGLGNLDARVKGSLGLKVGLGLL